MSFGLFGSECWHMAQQFFLRDARLMLRILKTVASGAAMVSLQFSCNGILGRCEAKP